MVSDRLGFGVFMPPYHPVGQNPTLALENDLDRIVQLDRLGFDEAWVGEHHSGGYEIISSPEIFVMAAAERTRHIKLGLGVVTLPYHNPFMVAERITMLDHLTRGRVLVGVGAGSSGTDVHLLGIDPSHTRRRTEEALDVLLHLLRSPEPLTVETDWFKLKDARLQLRPYSDVHITCTGNITPSGPKMAGKNGLGLISLGGLIVDPKKQVGRASLSEAWGFVEETAKEHGSEVDRANWRVVIPAHIAESRQQAERDVAFGLPAFCRYNGAALSADKGKTAEENVAFYRSGNMAVFGTPDDLIERIEELLMLSGGFGGVLLLGHDWADREATFRSNELIARYVIPHFQGQLSWPQGSHDWQGATRSEWFTRMSAASEAASRA